MRKLAIALGCLWMLLALLMYGSNIYHFLFGGDISSSGTYMSKSGNYFLVIDRTGGDLKYKVVNSRNHRQSVTTRWGSDYHNWFCTWGDEDRLWIYSSDVGTTVFVPNGELGEFVVLYYSPQFEDLMKQAPESHRQRLGSR